MMWEYRSTLSRRTAWDRPLSQDIQEIKPNWEDSSEDERPKDLKERKKRSHPASLSSFESDIFDLLCLFCCIVSSDGSLACRALHKLY